MPLFLVNMAVSAWVKFVQYQTAAVLMTVIMGIGLVYLLIANIQWTTHLVGSHTGSPQALIIFCSFSTAPLKV